MQHFKITIKVVYDDAFPVSPDMDKILKKNVEACVASSLLLNDPQMEAVIDCWRVEVEEV